jgi:hypothetical protein
MLNFTTEDLLQYLYKETGEEKTIAITNALNTNWSLREKMDILMASHSELNTIKLLAPRKQTLENIFNYAEKSVVELSL